jgi:hypothetical protein
MAMANGQSAIDDAFNRYAGKEGFTTITIKPWMFKLASFIAPEDEDLKKLDGKIDSFRLLASEDNGVQFTSEIREQMKTQDYFNIMEIVESKSKVNFYVRKKDDVVTDFVMIVSDTTEEVLLNIKGKFSLNDLSKMGDNHPAGCSSSGMANLRLLKNK